MADSRPYLATLIALGLTRLWLPGDPPPRVGDARVIAQGRFRLFAGWDALPEAERRLACRFRLLARGTIEIDGSFRANAREILSAEQEFRGLAPLPEASEGKDPLDDIAFDTTPGGDLGQALRRWMSLLEAKLPEGRLKTQRPRSRKKDPNLYYVRGRASFSVPKERIPPQPEPWPTLAVRPQEALTLDIPGLIAFAEALDTAAEAMREGGFQREADLKRAEVLRERLFGTMLSEGRPVIEAAIPLEPGPLSLMLAPTGTGKSVFSQVAALKWASEGVAVALVVPGVDDVLKTTRQLERARALLDLRVEIAPLTSPGARFRAVARAWERSGPFEGEGAWALERLGYHCPLRAHTTEESMTWMQRGKEPCNSLTPGTRNAPTRVACPFLSTCALHRHERGAPDARILVVNHHNLLLGKTRTPFAKGEELRRRSVMELVLAQCQVVIIDEVDELQKTMIDRDSGSLALSSRGRLSIVHRIFRELEETAAELNEGLRARDERARRDLMMIQTLAQELSHLLGRSDVTWPLHPRMRWSRSGDGFLCGRLFGDTSAPAMERFDALFEPEGTRAPLSPDASELRAALTGWVQPRLDDRDHNGERLGAIRGILDGWAWPEGEPSTRVRVQVGNLLVFRAILLGLEASLNRLRIRYPDLAVHALPSVGDLREALEWHGLPTISPLGALGHQVYGFSRSEEHVKGKGTTPARATGAGGKGREEEPSRREGPLRGIALQGAPHEDIVAIGDTTALGLVGQRRVVMGISATAWFPGSPLCHVQGALRFIRPDPPDPDAPKVSAALLPVTVKGEDGAEVPVSISGVGDPVAREQACIKMGRGLAPLLCDTLGAMEGDPEWASQARALIVTGSYREAQALAQGLLASLSTHAHPGAASLAGGLFLVPGPSADGVGIPPSHLLNRSEIESFPGKGGRILIAPLSIVARGHNILAPGTDRSAIGAIYLAVRPVPPLDDASRVLAHVSAMDPSPAEARDLLTALRSERRGATRRFQDYLQQAKPFTQLKPALRDEVLSDVLVELAQLAGRARRGGTSVRLYLIDGAFDARAGGWPTYLKALLARWEDRGLYPQMATHHGAFIDAIARLSDFTPKESAQ